MNIESIYENIHFDVETWRSQNAKTEEAALPRNVKENEAVCFFCHFRFVRWLNWSSRREQKEDSSVQFHANSQTETFIKSFRAEDVDLSDYSTELIVSQCTIFLFTAFSAGIGQIAI